MSEPHTVTPAGVPTLLALDDDERELAGLELEPLRAASSGPRRAAYDRLATALDDGEVGPDLAPVLGSVVELTLQTGRARSLYKAEGERVLTQLYRRTPQGQAAARHLEDVNRALAVLRGEEVVDVRVRMRTAGHVTVTITTPGATVTLASRADGVRLERLDPGPAHAASVTG